MAERTVSIRALLQDGVTKTLGRIRGNFKGLEGDVERVGRGLQPLASGFSRLLTAVAGFQAARSSIRAAEQQVQAEAALLQALRGRADQLERIRRAASEIQANTTAGDEALLEQAALLVNMGVSSERIPDALQATVDTSDALGVSLESVAKAIGLFESGLAVAIPRYAGY